MMNKKGVSIFRILLICLLFSFVIWVFVLTFQEIKKKNQQNDIVLNDNLRLLDDNSQFNPNDFIYNFTYYGYQNSNINTQASTYDILDFESKSYIYQLAYTYDAWYGWTYNFYNNSTITDSNVNTSLSSPTFDSNDNLILSSALYSPNGSTHRESIFSNATNLGNSRSFALVYNCNIPVEFFNFTMVYNFPISTSRTLKFYVLTDAGFYQFGIITFNSTTHTFVFSSDNIVNAINGATTVRRFGFLMAQSSNTSNSLGYLPQYDSSNSSTSGFNYYTSSAYSNYYNSFSNVTDKYNLCFLTFHSSSLNSNYVSGYNTGYNDGINYMQGQITSLSQQINDLNNNITSLNNTISSQQTIITNLQNQLNQTQNNFKDLFFTFADIPVKTIHNILNFDFFGMNLFKFFTGVLTALGCIWLIKKFI